MSADIARRLPGAALRPSARSAALLTMNACFEDGLNRSKHFDSSARFQVKQQASKQWLARIMRPQVFKFLQKPLACMSLQLELELELEPELSGWHADLRSLDHHNVISCSGPTPPTAPQTPGLVLAAESMAQLLPQAEHSGTLNICHIIFFLLSSINMVRIQHICMPVGKIAALTTILSN